MLADLGDPAQWEPRWNYGKWEPWPRLSEREGVPRIEPSISVDSPIRAIHGEALNAGKRMAPPPQAAIDAAEREPADAALAWWTQHRDATVADLIRAGGTARQEQGDVVLHWDLDPRVWVSSIVVDAAAAASAVRWDGVDPVSQRAIGTWAGPRGPVSLGVPVDRDLSHAHPDLVAGWAAYAARLAAEDAASQRKRAEREATEAAERAQREAADAARLAELVERQRQEEERAAAALAAEQARRSAAAAAVVQVPVQLDSRRYDAAVGWSRGCEVLGFAVRTALADRMAGATKGFGEAGSISPGQWVTGQHAKDWILVVRPTSPDWSATVLIRRDGGQPAQAIPIRSGRVGQPESYDPRHHGRPVDIQIGA